jgi:N,N'-diacetyllegionaminate synthase
MHDIGLSDHTMGSQSSVIAAAFGAVMIEKHYTVDKTLDKSADHWLSVDPQELKEIVDGVRKVDTLRGVSKKTVFAAEQQTREFDKRSIVLSRDIKKGESATIDMFTFKRPGTGLWPEKLGQLVGRVAVSDLKADTIIKWEHFRLK